MLSSKESVSINNTSAANDTATIRQPQTQSTLVVTSDATAIRNAFEQDGVVGPLEILSLTEANDVLQEVLAWERTLHVVPTAVASTTGAPLSHHRGNNNSNNHPIKIVGNLRFKPHLFLPKLNHLVVRNSRLIQAVQAALQSNNLLLWSCDLNIKESNSGMYFAPHQDATYTGLDPPTKCLTAWIALSDPVSHVEGCLEFWKASHRLGQVPHYELSHDTDPFNILSRGQRVLDDVVMPSLQSLELVRIPLRGGQATLHHFHTVHQSGPNRNPQQMVRIGLACRYIDATVRHISTLPSLSPLTKRKGDDDDDDDVDYKKEKVEGNDNEGILLDTRECVTWISGQVLHNGFDLEPILPEFPTDDEIERGRQAHAIGMEREAANYFKGSNVRQYDERTHPITNLS